MAGKKLVASLYSAKVSAEAESIILAAISVKIFFIEKNKMIWLL
jgi:hypothetical protein